MQNRTDKTATWFLWEKEEKTDLSARQGLDVREVDVREAEHRRRVPGVVGEQQGRGDEADRGPRGRLEGVHLRRGRGVFARNFTVFCTALPRLGAPLASLAAHQHPQNVSGPKNTCMKFRIER